MLYVTNVPPKLVDKPFNSDIADQTFFYGVDKVGKIFKTYIVVMTRSAYEFTIEYLLFRFGDPRITQLNFADKLYFVFTIDDEIKVENVLYKKEIADDGRQDLHFTARRLSNTAYVLCNIKSLSSNKKKEKNSGSEG